MARRRLGGGAWAFERYAYKQSDRATEGALVLPPPKQPEVMTMSEAPSANLELAIVLPLGVLVNQLMRIEAQLRLLNMKTFDFAEDCSRVPFAGPIAANLEKIHDALDSISGLVADIEADVRPRSADAARSPRKSQSDWDD